MLPVVTRPMRPLRALPTSLNRLGNGGRKRLHASALLEWGRLNGGDGDGFTTLYRARDVMF